MCEKFIAHKIGSLKRKSEACYNEWNIVLPTSRRESNEELNLSVNECLSKPPEIHHNNTQNASLIIDSQVTIYSLINRLGNYNH